MRLKAMSDAAREAQRAYYREWRKKNQEKIRENKRRYWEKKGKEMEANNEAKRT